jgi:flagellar protein FlaG
MSISPIGNGSVPQLPEMPGRTAPVGSSAKAGGSTQAQDPKQPSAATSEQLQQAVKKVAEAVQATGSTLEFTIDQDTDKTVVKIVDNQTQQVIRQIPSQEMLDIAKAIDKIQGLLLRQKA